MRRDAPPGTSAWEEQPGYAWSAAGGQGAHAATPDAGLVDHGAEAIPAQDLNAPLAVVLPPGFYRTSRLPSRRALVALGLGGLLAAGGLAWVLVGGSTKKPKDPTVDQQLATPAVMEAPREVDAPAAQAPMADDGVAAIPAVTRFDERAALLETSLIAFRARMRDPIGGADCPAVRAARASVSGGFDALSAAMTEAGGGIDVERSMRFNKLGADVGELDREFARMRCARTAPEP